MDEWGNNDPMAPRKEKETYTGGAWDVGMTAVVLAAVVVVSFLVAYLTKDNPSRPFWLLGFSFSAPVAALMGAVVLHEKVHSTMTPSTSRGAQFGLAMCSVAAAFLVGCGCQVSNTEAKEIVTEEKVVTSGWSDVLIVLDKSGSMYGDRDETATQAVIDLINSIDESAEVGLLIDDWYKPNTLKNRVVPLAPLTQAQRDKLIAKAQTPVDGWADYTEDFKAIEDMIADYRKRSDEPIPILLISDGENSVDLNRLTQQCKDLKLVVYYLYVTQDHSDGVEKLALASGGESVYVSDHDSLLGQMKQAVTSEKVDVVTSTTYKDALRDIQESTPAKTVTGIMLLLLGLLIGISLTIMLSVRKQKRFQVILSPLMAVASFLLLVFGDKLISEPWIREGVAFSLLGLVIMRANHAYGSPKAVAAAPDPAAESVSYSPSSSEWD